MCIHAEIMLVSGQQVVYKLLASCYKFMELQLWLFNLVIWLNSKKFPPKVACCVVKWTELVRSTSTQRLQRRVGIYFPDILSIAFILHIFQILCTFDSRSVHSFTFLVVDKTVISILFVNTYAITVILSYVKANVKSR